MRWIITVAVVVTAFLLCYSKGLFSTATSVVSLWSLIICAGFPLIIVFSKFNDED